MGITIDRGYQRLDESEPFGYKDGVRNVRTNDRFKVVFVHRDGRERDEPAWADGGTYMAFLRILQRPENFAALPDEDHRDAVRGRRRDGIRLDLVGTGTQPHAEPSDPPPALPPTSHVLKAGPRGAHDAVQIFRRGMPFVEATPDGQLRVGLNFCSFQATLDQFDVVFSDWMMNPELPAAARGRGRRDRCAAGSGSAANGRREGRFLLRSAARGGRSRARGVPPRVESETEVG